MKGKKIASGTICSPALRGKDLEFSVFAPEQMPGEKPYPMIVYVKKHIC